MSGHPFIAHARRLAACASFAFAAGLVTHAEAAAASATVTVVAPDAPRVASAWAGDFAAPSPAELARLSDPLALLPKVRRITPTSVTANGGAAGDWSLVGPQAGAQRFTPAVIVDPVRQRLVSFGGADSVVSAATWTFSLTNGTWVPLATAGTPPPARRLHGAVYDSHADRMLVFGGLGDGGLLDDVWQLTLSGTPTWSPLAVTGTPGPRASFGCAYDAAGDRLIVYGGYDSDTLHYGATSDAWALSLAGSPEWTELAPTGAGPVPRFGFTSGWDPAARALYVFGGEDSTQTNELWKLSLSGTPVWSRVLATGLASPSPRAWAAGGFDPVSQRFVLYGGLSVSLDPQGWLWSVATDADVWAIVPGAASPAWTDVSPDPGILPRWGAGSAVSPAGDLYVCGGVSEHDQLLGDVWKLNVANPVAWQGYEDLFPPRLQEVMVLDPARHRLIAFGGTDGSYRNDVYVHSLDSGRGWALLSPTGAKPAPRRLHTAIWDAPRDRMIVFGGFDGGFYNDVWQLSFAGPNPAWSKLTPSGTPPSARAGHVAVVDAIGERMIVTSGYDGVSLPNARTNDTWALSLSGSPAWTVIPATNAPPARSSASAIYDSARHRLVLFGGTNPSFLDDCWALPLDGAPQWTNLAPAAAIPAREEHAAIYDASRDRMVVFGGYDTPTPNSNNFGDLWSLEFPGTSAWSALAPGGSPPSPRWGMKTAYDASADGMWMYGGWDWTYSQQLWFLQWSQPVEPLPVATQQAFATADRAVLQWQLPTRARPAALVQRSTDGVHWRPAGRMLPAGLTLPWSDRAVTPGESYAYRMLVSANGRSMASTPVWVTIPNANTGVTPPTSLAFALRAAGTASRSGAVALSCSIPAGASARLELLDVSGRVLDSRAWSGAGERRVELGGGLAPGVYFARLTSGAHSASLKSVVLR